MNLNYFCDKHGKNNRDTHFSHISRFIKKEELTNRALKSSQDIVDAIIKGQNLANQNSKEGIFPILFTINILFNINIYLIFLYFIYFKEKKVLTYAIAVDEEMIASDILENPFNYDIKIPQIQSYYNYRTLGPDYDVVTSVLSFEIENSFISTSISNEGKMLENNYEPELVREPLTGEKFDVIKRKKVRITSSISKIKDSRRIINSVENKNIQDYYDLVIGNSEPVKNLNQNINAKFCRVINISKKKKICKDCIEICSYPIESLLSPKPEDRLTQEDILEELKIHHHPKTRIMPETGLFRSTEEGAIELAEHYIFSHNIEAPFFFKS